MSGGLNLRAFARHRAVVCVAPLVPKLRSDRFRVVSVEDGTVALEKEGSPQQVTIPLQRVAEILPDAQSNAPKLMLNGRLQWLTMPQEWHFFPEQPGDSDGCLLGVPKDSSLRDPLVAQLAPQLNSRGMQFCWSHLDKLPERLNARTHEVFYDTDGRYLHQRGPDRESILLISALRT